MNQEYFITNKNINNIKIALLSDIHYDPLFDIKIFTKLTNQLIKERPNYICIAGDIIDYSDEKEITPLIDWLDTISDISPIIISFGNHEYKYKKSKNKWQEGTPLYLKQELKKLNNIYILENKSITINNITFHGYNLSYDYYENKKESYTSFKKEMNNINIETNNNNYNILLFHSPLNIFKYIKETNKLTNIDLILCGHTHNGCIPFVFTRPLNKIFKTNISLISPKLSLFPRYAQGKITKPINGYIFQGILKFSNRSIYKNFNNLYSKKIQFINIKKDLN